jgi:hypothetical protein
MPKASTQIPGRPKRVHPGLVWVELESATVEVDGCLEVFPVAIATHASLDRHDLAVDAFGDSVRDSVSAVADNVG